MKVKVIKSFIDKHTGKVHDLNEVFNVTDDRYKEIEKVGHFVEKVADTEK